MYKKDLKRAYRQIPVDPKDYKFLGYKWRGSYCFDLVLPFGLRSATLACQRTTTAIAYMFKSEFNFACINYVSDFRGVEKDLTTASIPPYDFAQMLPSMESMGFMMGDSFMPPTLISSLNSHCTSTPSKSSRSLSASNGGLLFYLVSAS